MNFVHITTLLLFDRQDLNNLFVSSENPINLFLFIKIWFIVSKVYVKSIKIVSVYTPDKKPVSILFSK